MKLYKLLKDLPTVKAGAIFKEKIKIDGTRVLKACESGRKHSILVREIDNFDEWFEEIEEPTDSIHWTPKKDDEYFWMNSYGETQPDVWDGDSIDSMRLALGMVYCTEEECERAKERKLAKVRLRRTSTFNSDFCSDTYAYTVGYDYKHERLYVTKLVGVIIGSPILYKSFEDAEKSIDKNREDWKIYFGIREWE